MMSEVFVMKWEQDQPPSVVHDLIFGLGPDVLVWKCLVFILEFVSFNVGVIQIESATLGKFPDLIMEIVRLEILDRHVLSSGNGGHNLHKFFL